MKFIFLLMVLFPFASKAMVDKKTDTLQLSYYLKGELIPLDPTAKLNVYAGDSLIFSTFVLSKDIVSFVNLPRIEFDSSDHIILEFIYKGSQAKADVSSLIYQGDLIIRDCKGLSVYEFTNQHQLKRFARKNPYWENNFYWLYEETLKEEYPLMFFETSWCGEYDQLVNPVKPLKSRKDSNQIERVRNLR
ncbi:MAG: hypothetical protein ACI837_003245 [Crocinitomicaceae bacterium]|jgi:hypothetical protein